MTRSNIVRYYINNYINWSTISIRCWIHKRHSYLVLSGELLGVFCEYLWENWLRYNSTALYQARKLIGTFFFNLFKWHQFLGLNLLMSHLLSFPSFVIWIIKNAFHTTGYSRELPIQLRLWLIMTHDWILFIKSTDMIGGNGTEGPNYTTFTPGSPFISCIKFNPSMDK